MDQAPFFRLGRTLYQLNGAAAVLQKVPVGTTKQEGGATYRLNQNHRWERINSRDNHSAEQASLPMITTSRIPRTKAPDDFFYRLEDSPNELPTHWAYSDAWEFDEESGDWRENRSPGFQVWADLPSAIAAATGITAEDGDYSSGYTHLSVIDASEYDDGSDEWFSIHPDNVNAVYSVPLSIAADAVKTAWQSYLDELDEDDADEIDGDDDYFKEWIEDNLGEIWDTIRSNSVEVEPFFVDTLPKP